MGYARRTKENSNIILLIRINSTLHTLSALPLAYIPLEPERIKLGHPLC